MTGVKSRRMIGPHTLPAAAVALVLLALPAGARAEGDRAPERTVAMMSAQIGGDADPALRMQLQEAVRRGLDAAGYTLIDRDQLRKRLPGEEALIDCTSKTCLAQISDAVGASRFLRAKIEASGASYSVELELLDLEGESVRRLEESCAVCTILELTELIGKVTESLMTTREEKPVPVVIVSQPEGAQLQLGGRVLGPAPFTGELPPGQHRVTAHLPGHGEVNKDIDVKSGSDQQRFEIILVPTETPTAPEADDPRPFKLWKYVAAGTGAAVFVTGVYVLSLHHDGTCDATGVECEERYNTLLGGLGTVAAGLAIGGASGWMFMRDARDARAAETRPTATIAPTRGGAYATVRLRF